MVVVRDRVEALDYLHRNGCKSCVRKPVDFDEFIEAARQLGLYRLLLNEPPQN